MVKERSTHPQLCLVRQEPLPIKCAKHPRYKGVGRPTSRCPTCMDIYLARHPDEQDPVGLKHAIDLAHKLGGMGRHGRTFLRGLAERINRKKT